MVSSETNSLIDKQNLSESESLDLSYLVIPLLKGILYRDEQEKLWYSLVKQQLKVQGYVAVLGLELVLDENEGFAWLRQLESDDDSQAKLPCLVSSFPLSYPLSVLLVVLRKRLLEFNAQSSDTRLILNFQDIAELMQAYLPTGSNEAKWRDQLSGQIQKACKIGFLKKLKKSQLLKDEEIENYEVRRIIVAFIDSQWLGEFEKRLAEYRSYSEEENRS